MRIAILVKTSSTSTRQRTPRLLHDRTSETNRPLLVAILSRNSIAVSNDTRSLALRSLNNHSVNVGGICVVVVGKVDHSSSINGIATEEYGMFVETGSEESIEVRDVGHASESLGLGLLVGSYDGSAGREVIGSVCAIVGGNDDVYIALGLDQRPEGHG